MLKIKLFLLNYRLEGGMEIEPLKFVIKFVKLLSGRNRLWFPWNLSFPLSPLKQVHPPESYIILRILNFMLIFSIAIQTSVFGY